MDLVQLTDARADTAQGTNVSQLALSARARKLASVQVGAVERKFVTAEIRMTGKVTYDETRVAFVTTRVDGRLDRLYADFTGMKVKRGDHLVRLYSPELLSAQEELIQSLLAGDEVTTSAVREKLRLWGITPEQIGSIERSRKAADHLTVYAPISGTVIGKDAVEGKYVRTGSRIYTIADLSRVWVKLDAYESDVAFVKYGQEVEISTESYPGRIFRGTVAFVDPVLDERTRTVNVRVNVPNKDGVLKPGMFVRTVVRSKIASDGRAVGPDMTGKWMCPMHPEIVKAAEDRCGVCGMALVRAEETGVADAAATNAGPPLVIPASAPLITGKRAVVYVQQKGKEGSYEGREIVLGPRAAEYYVVHDGLSEGEIVVVKGAFMIDSTLQIMARPSMMTPGTPPQSRLR